MSRVFLFLFLLRVLFFALNFYLRCRDLDGPAAWAVPEAPGEAWGFWREKCEKVAELREPASGFGAERKYLATCDCFGVLSCGMFLQDEMPGKKSWQTTTGKKKSDKTRADKSGQTLSVAPKTPNLR